MKTLALAAILFAAPLAAQEPAPAPAQVIIVETHSPVLAGVISALIPGTGQAYNGQWGKAAWFFTSSVALAWAGAKEDADGAADFDACVAARRGNCSESDSGALFGVAFFANWAFGIVDAARSANHLNAEARARVQPTASAGRVGFRVLVPTG